MENSKIEWTDHTFNPWIGCTKVSDGCKHCYAEAQQDKRYGRVQWGPQGKRIRTAAANWRKPLKWDREAKAAGKRARVFCSSLADVFEEKPDQPEIDEWRSDLFELISSTPNLDWLLLTKRPENVRKAWHWELMGYPPNVWIGTSVENQEQADKRIPALLEIPAAVRFLSMEPLLGQVYIDQLPRIDWVIVGGESGQNARPMHPYWARYIRNQCQAVGVPFFFKQWGEWQPRHTLNGEKMFRVGKHAAGRLLDGHEWNEFPLISKTETTGD